MMGPPPCEHHAECKLFVPGTCQRRADPKIHGVEEKGSDRIPRSRLQPGLHAGPRKFYDFTPLARPYTSGEKESIDRRKTYTGMVPAKVVLTDLPTTVRVTYHGYLVKACPEHLQAASDD